MAMATARRRPRPEGPDRAACSQEEGSQPGRRGAINARALVLQRQADAATGREAVGRAEREVAAGAGAVVVDGAVVARGGAALDEAARKCGAAVAGTLDLEVAAAVDDQ